MSLASYVWVYLANTLKSLVWDFLRSANSHKDAGAAAAAAPVRKKLIFGRRINDLSAPLSFSWEKHSGTRLSHVREDGGRYQVAMPFEAQGLAFYILNHFRRYVFEVGARWIFLHYRECPYAPPPPWMAQLTVRRTQKETV
jgi:hypothetical protein